MYRLVYVSAAYRPMDDHELAAILNVARRHNQAAGLTGMLLYLDGNFLQVLEGEREVVEATLQRIEADPRHHMMLVILREDGIERCFHDWSMGFRRLSPTDTAASPELFKLSATALREKLAPEQTGALFRLVSTFYEVGTREIL